MSTLSNAMSAFPDTDKMVVVSFSGGFDSYVVAHLATLKYGKERVRAVGFYYRQKQRVELEYAENACNKLGIDFREWDMYDFGSMLMDTNATAMAGSEEVPTADQTRGETAPRVEVPGRNLVFLSLALSYAQALGCEFVLGGMMLEAGVISYDAQPDFVSALNNVVQLNDAKYKLRVVCPLQDAGMTKADAVGVLKEVAGGDKHALAALLMRSWSCFDPKRVSGESVCCGKCLACEERRKAISAHGYSDPLPYYRAA